MIINQVVYLPCKYYWYVKLSFQTKNYFAGISKSDPLYEQKNELLKKLGLSV